MKMYMNTTNYHTESIIEWEATSWQLLSFHIMFFQTSNEIN